MFIFCFINDTAPTELYTLSLHDALPICRGGRRASGNAQPPDGDPGPADGGFRVLSVLKIGGSVLRDAASDRKSTRLNSSHTVISYAVFCLKKKSPGMNIRKRIIMINTRD